MAAFRHVDGAVGLEQRAQIALDAGLVAAPDDFGHAQLGRARKAQRSQRPRQQNRANAHVVAFGHRHRGHLVAPGSGRQAGDQGVDDARDQFSQDAFFVPQVDADRFLPFAAVGEVPVAGDQAEQQAQFLAAFWPELSLARLHPEFVAYL